MFWLKACPKCAGALHLERDIYGWYLTCVNCGHHLDFVEESLSRKVTHHRTPVARDRRKSLAAAGGAR